MDTKIDIYFSGFFNVAPETLEDYGAFNISLINDLPVFIDPFLLFNSENPAYQKLHRDIIEYVIFLRDRSTRVNTNKGILRALYTFPEVKQNWLGFSQAGNSGSGLGFKFARSLHDNLRSVFANFGNEQITNASHIEKLCLVGDGVGRDNISDFTTNLIKGFLLNYTQEFAMQCLDPSCCGKRYVTHTRFNYSTETWMSGKYYLPIINNDYVLLTPKDILTKDDTWINRSDMLDNLAEIADALPDSALRAQVNDYLKSRLSGREQRNELLQVYSSVIQRFPEIVDHYILGKEKRGNEAVDRSSTLVEKTQFLFINQVQDFVNRYLADTLFYKTSGNTLSEARARVEYLKHVIENKDGYRFFYVDGKPIKREQDIQLLFILTWFGSPSDLNREVNNGRGAVDFKISRGNHDKSLVEFKLASNSQLKRNLQNQVGVYEAANQTKQSLKVIIYFSEAEQQRVIDILKEIGQKDNKDIILIDARNDNKPSASVT